ncbi:LysR family transcriptional regulator [Pseudoalteromonas shioyasakiensis]|uniref:LysR family transcriptional regulator n=1 Tax=Pseudoalteromonas shioyasakiensis TaxID=1190813 RepID=UPI0021187A53|nr:LysR family transcriptional regulator [Pseudoalteromonas shioyasakiensis]MCQ8877573.1 LysR family transcriptional regulator [Pseudoalteromonas shioyasakiensis]
MIKTEDLTAFLAVVEHGSFSKAARSEGVQIATLSRAISRLEVELRTTLFNRTTRKVVLTEEGNLFKVHAQQAVRSIKLGIQKLKINKDQPSGKLKIDASLPFMLSQMVPLIGEFNRLYPKVIIEISTNDSVIDLLDNKVDIAFRVGEPADSTLRAKFLGHSPLCIVASPTYLASSGTPHNSRDLKEHILLGFTNAAHLNNWHLLDKSFTPEVLPVASSGEVLKHLCINGMGIIALSYYMVHEEIAQGLLVEVLPHSIEHPNKRESVYAVYYKQSELASRISIFLEYVKSRLVLSNDY